MNEFLTSAFDGDGWSPQALYCRGIHLWHPQVTAGCVDHLADVDMAVLSLPEIKIGSPAQDYISSHMFTTSRSCQSTPQQAKILFPGPVHVQGEGFLVIFFFTATLLHCIM
jgi:hypothetical protein